MSASAENAAVPAVPEWPEHGLDVDALAAGGWRPVPFHEFVLKIHGRCNLSCDYCYVYESADQSWRVRPGAMSEEVVRATVRRIAEHIEAHDLAEIDVTLHGGEPLLAGPRMIGLVARELRAVLPAGRRARVGVQTNGVLLTERMLDLLGDLGIGVAVSLDGDREAHDRHRRYADGRGSHRAVMRGLTLLAGSYRSLYRGLLCTVDLANDPIVAYEALLETAPPQVDLLLPHGTWTDPPPGLPAPQGATPYADWMIEVFDRWYRTAPRRTGIRLFEEIMNLVLGGGSRSERIGLSPVAIVVIDTDGTIQQVDTLKTVYAGAPETGLHVDRDPFDAALWHPGVVARQIGLSALCETCLRCPVRDVCGGGSYAHRYRPGTGHRNPSVYCRDLERIIRHVSGTMRSDLAAAIGRGA
ncbi:FxsB family cyclophane-forming radical SAM/SPASM peptide maturase [Thermomonospora amylolytica]|uniref:FxsB family cyclophane-forming radical SAM/SPASM peptide maturase n=1 Tax=Thermomonospora amylolytica TaxID=1411117 RepID=UPI000E6B5463|nr:FxsB family cyclophane-forming radical SAM/SPASM peptide maturase [Thermomonospora amylolytica]